jgi:hypothetical protein
MEHNIKMDLRHRGWEDLDLIPLAQDRDLLQALVKITFTFHKSQKIS